MLCGFLFKDRVLLPAYKLQVCAVRSYDNTYRRDKSCFAPILHSSGTTLRLNFYVFFQKDQARTCICTGTWVAPPNICVTKVNMRNLFYNKMSEYSHCPQ